MKQKCLIYSFIITLIATCLPGLSAAQVDMQVTLSLDKQAYLMDEEIHATLTITNQNGEIISRHGFTLSAFEKDLLFIKSDGSSISATSETGSPEPQAPPMIMVGDRWLQGNQVEIVPAGWTVTKNYDVRNYYSINEPGHYKVKALIPIRVFSLIEYTENEEALLYSSLSSIRWEGTLESNTVEFVINADADSDQYSWPEADSRLSPYSVADCNDNDASINPGAAEVTGDGIDNDCDPATQDVAPVVRGTVDIQADIHTVGAGSHPGSSKAPLDNLQIRLYDMSVRSCVDRNGITWKQYRAIWQGCYPASFGIGTTDSTGKAHFEVNPGNYFAVSEYTNTQGEAIYVGARIGELASEDTVHKYMQIIEKANGKKVPAKYRKKTGSELLIIEPEYIEWSGTEEYYPFVFESQGDWSVATSVSPPEGFIVDHDNLAEEVNTELEAVQFVVTDIGSDWVSTEVEYKLTHKGKKEKVKSKIGVKLSKKLAKEKKLTRYGKKLNK